MFHPIAGAGSIQRKLNLILVATLGIALFIAATTLLLVQVRNEWRNAQRDLATMADVVALASEAALAFADPRTARQNLQVLAAQPTVVAAALYDNQRQPFAAFEAPGEREARIPPVSPGVGMSFGMRYATVVRPVLSNGEPIGHVYVQTRHGLAAEVAEYIGWLLVATLASLLGALLLARRLQRTLTAPILEVSRVARAVLEQGTFDVRATRRSHDEVGQLVDAFNAMLEELGKRARVLQEANAALVASEARYQLAARGSSAGLWDWDMRAGTMFHSPRLKSVLGYTGEEFPDHPDAMLRLTHPDDAAAVQRALDAHLSSDTPYQAECRLRQKDGGWRWFLVTGTALRDEHGTPYRMAGSLIDISERKQTEILLQQSNRAKDAFLATLAHELRNPLAPLRTGLQILKRPGASELVVGRTLETMDRQLTHMVRLIDDLLDISRINSGKIHLEFAPTSLCAVVQAALDLSRPAMDAAGHALDVDLPAEDIQVSGDETRLTQAVGNLLNNAAKYTPAGGRVRLSLRRDGGQAALVIQDNGIGIPPEMLDQVFSLFAQVENGPGHAGGGLGIGLFLVRSLLEMHGGSVQASSAGHGQGSTFTVRLPCLAETTPAPAPATPHQAARLAGTGPSRVLVVDDNVDAAETLTAFLEMIGFETRAAHDGASALSAAVALAPQVVLLDIGLPDTSGYEVSRAMRAHPELSRVTLIALTGWGAEDDRRRALEAGFDHHLTKPVDLHVLEELLRSVLEAQGQ